MFEFIKKIQEEKRIQKEEEIARKKIENYYAQMNRTIKYDIKMSKQSDDGIWLWDTERFVDQFMQEIKDHNLEVDMRNCNFGEFIMFVKWLSVALKMTGDKRVIELMQEYVKYGVKHYNTKLFGRKIIRFTDVPVFPAMVFDAFNRQRYGRVNFFDIYNESDEFLTFYNSYYAPYIYPSKKINWWAFEIQIIDDGNDIIFKEKPLPDFNSRDTVEAWLDEGLEELWADMPEDVIRKYQEVIQRFENDESDN